MVRGDPGGILRDRALSSWGLHRAGSPGVCEVTRMDTGSWELVLTPIFLGESSGSW